MQYYRELMASDPFRRDQREKQSSADDGDLFGLRKRARRMRILVDDDTIHDDSEVDRILSGLCSYDTITVWHITMSDASKPAATGERALDWRRRTPGVVYLTDHTSRKGWSSYPGPLYGWTLVESEKRKRAGNVSPGVELEQGMFDFLDRGGKDAIDLDADEIQRAALLAQVARSVGADIVISEAPTVGRHDLPSSHAANFFSRRQSIPVIAHYLRTQQLYVIDPTSRGTINRRGFYQEAVCAMAPRIWHWLAKCQRAAAFLGGEALPYLSDCHQMIGRLLRALKAWDDVLFHIGSCLSAEVTDDAADGVDRVLLFVCGAVDVLARSMHRALRLSGTERGAKLHSEQWYSSKFRPTYAAAAGIDELDRLQRYLPIVFELRNSIHSHALEAIGAFDSPAQFVELSQGRMNLAIPLSSAESLQQLDSTEQQRWGVRLVGPLVIADLAQLTAAALTAVFDFLDQLTAIVSFVQIWDKEKVLQENIISAKSSLGDDRVAVIGQLLGLRPDSGTDDISSDEPDSTPAA